MRNRTGQFTPLAAVMADTISSHFPALKISTPTVPASAPRDADDLDAASRRGMASATSMLAICLHELDGTDLERGVARDIARRVVCAYLDQMQMVAR